MASASAVSRAAPGTADPVRAVAVVSTGTVEIHPEQPYGTRKPLYWWLLTSRRWTPPRPINAYIIEHAKGLILFDTGQDRASVRRRERSPVLLVGDLTYGAKLLMRGQVPGVGARRQLVETTTKVLALKQTMPDLVVLPAHDPPAAQRLLELKQEATMASFENTVTIRRPVEDVFAFLADFENVPAWNYAIVETRKVSHGPVGVGTTYRQTRSVPRRSEEGFEVTVFEPASRLEVRGEIGPFRARVRYALEPSGSGTRLTNAVELQSSGLLRLVAPLATSRVKRAVAANLDVLRQVLERGDQRGAG